ncbi:MAG: hypothetical protein QXE27_02815 [Thermoplasmata archaeon]
MERFCRRVLRVYANERFRNPIQMASYLHKNLLKRVVEHIESGEVYSDVTSSIIDLYDQLFVGCTLDSLEELCNMKFFCAEMLPYLNENDLKNYPMIKRTEKKIRKLILDLDMSSDVSNVEKV